MPMPEVDIDEARREVEDAAIAGAQPGPLRAGDDDLLQATLRRPRDEDVVSRVFCHVAGIRGSLCCDGHRPRV